jgi:hypothetical protein
MSGLFCPAADWCLMVSDELRGIHRLSISRDANNNPSVRFEKALEFVPAAGDFKEYDLEAIAHAGDAVFFFGSHANQRKNGKVNPGAHFVAIAKLTDLRSRKRVPVFWSSLDKLFARFDTLKGALNRQLQCGGLNLEGTAIIGSTLFVGLRSPTHGNDGKTPGAYVVSAPLSGLMTQDYAGARLHILPTDAPFIGIRDMERVGDAIVLITGDAGVNDLDPEIAPECEANLNKENKNRPFELRVWKPAAGDAFQPEPRVTFAHLDELDKDGKKNRAKLEAIAADPGRDGAFFVIHDGSDVVRYLKDVVIG